MKNQMTKMLSISTLIVIALAVSAPAFAQTVNHPGITVTLNAKLRPPALASGSGFAEYQIIRARLGGITANGKVHTRFTVQCENMPLSKDAAHNYVDVFVGPGVTANKESGKLVGRISLKDGAGALLLIDAQVPEVKDGTTVWVKYTDGTPALKGQF